MAEPVLGLLLAGGQSRRMGGGDKCLRPLGGRPILERIVERARPQCASLVLNANGEPARFASFGLPVIADPLDGFQGPLAGVLAGLDWAAAHWPDLPWVVSIATDTPFLPTDLVARLLAEVTTEGAELACAASAGWSHPVFGLWPVALREELRAAMVSEGTRKIDAWTARYRLATVVFESAPIDPFFNTNAPEDLARAEQLLAAGGGGS